MPHRSPPELSLPNEPYVPGTGQPRPAELDYSGVAAAVVCRHGAELYDHGAFWEAHVAWEHLWVRASGPERDALQGLIQGAAARLKTGPRLAAAAGRLRSRALHHLDEALSAGLSQLYGLDLQRWRQRIARLPPSP